MSEHVTHQKTFTKYLTQSSWSNRSVPCHFSETQENSWKRCGKEISINFAKVHNSQEKIKKITANSHPLTDQKKIDNYYWVTLSQKFLNKNFFAKYISQTAVIYKLQVYKKAYSSGDQELFFWKETKNTTTTLA